MKKFLVLISMLAMICLIFASCSDKTSADEEEYNFNMQTLYEASGEYDKIFEKFQYHDRVLYGLLATYEGDTMETKLQQIVTIDLTSGEESTYFDKEAASELGQIIDFAFDSNEDMWILSFGESYILNKVIDGKVDTQIELDNPVPEDGISLQQMLYIDEKGQFYSNFGYDEISILNSEGQTVAEIELEGMRKSFVKLQDKTYAAYGNESYRLAEINVETKKLESSKTITEQYISDVYSAEGLNKEYCFYDENGMYAVDKEDNIIQLFGWTDYGFASTYPDRIFVSPEGDVLCCNWDSIYRFKRVSADEADKRQVLKLAAFDAGEALMNLVADFNLTNDEYMISIVDYSTYNTGSDKYAGLNKLNTEIIGGNPPDLIDMRNIDSEQYISKGILEDLYPYLDEDPDFNREELLENVLKAMGDGEKLYGLTTTFRINTFVAKTSEMDLSNWNFEGLQAMIKSNPEIILGGTKTSLLELVCTYMQDNFVDWDSNTASFDSPEFIAFLEACNTLPEESEIIEIYDIEYKEVEDLATYAGANLSSFSDLATYENIWKTDTSIIGYPETGSTIGLRMYIGMLSESDNKDAAWSFLRTTLKTEVQMPNAEWAMGLPINKSAFEATKANASVVPEGLEDNWDEDMINQILSSTPTEEQVNKVAEVASSADKLSSNNTIITDIVLEEAGYYFDGGKTAQEVAEIIQDRVTTYINEQA